jgi:hypothetical protein
MSEFKPIDDLAIEDSFATDTAVLDRVRQNQRHVWEDLGDVLVQQMDRTPRTSWEWVVIWAAPWFWSPGDRSVNLALLCEGLRDTDNNCELEFCFVFSQLGAEPAFDIGVSTKVLTTLTQILEFNTADYRFENERFGFLQLWMRAATQPALVVTSAARDPDNPVDIDQDRRQVRDFANIRNASFSAYATTQLVIAINNTDDGGGPLSGGAGEIWRAHVCGHGMLIYYLGSLSPPANVSGFYVDSEPPQGRRYTYSVWAYAALVPHQVGIRVVRHSDRGWFTARQDQIATGTTQTQIAFQSLTEGDRALYGMRRPWALWFENQEDGVGGVNVPGVEVSRHPRIYPGPRHADRLRHRLVCLVIAWQKFKLDTSTIPVNIYAEMSEPDEDSSVLLYTAWGGTKEVQAPALVVSQMNFEWPLRAGALPARTWTQLLEQSVITSVVYGRNPEDPGTPLLGVGASPYLHRITCEATRFRCKARIVLGSIWSEEV